MKVSTTVGVTADATVTVLNTMLTVVDQYLDGIIALLDSVSENERAFRNVGNRK